MRLRLAVILCFAFLFSGCRKDPNALDSAVALRNKVLNGSGCSFQTTVTADYGEMIYIFTMDCKSDQNGDLTFCVVEPETIAGISGTVSGFGGTIIFDDKVLAFQTMADGQVTPVSAPWLFMKTLRSGYLRDASATDDGLQITIDDSYQENALQLRILTKGESPKSGEIFWQGRRVLTLTVESFTFL